MMEEKKIAGIKSTEYIKDGMILGLGTGSTAYYMIDKVGQMVANGLNIKAVATSVATTKLANELNIPIVSIDDVREVDLVIDGVDEIDPEFNAIKGGGGALYREKMVATIAKEVIWIMDSTKQVDAIGDFPLPVEILPYGHKHTFQSLKELNLNPVIRKKDGDVYITDNHNYIADLHIGRPMNIKDVEDKLRAIPGVIETGLFLNQCNRIIIGTKEGPLIIENNNK